MFEKILKGARSGQPGAGGVKHPGMKQKNISTGDWKNVPTEQLRAAIGAFAPHAASSDQNKEIAAAMVKELGSRGKDHPDDELVNVGDSWNGGNGQPEKMHAIPKPPAHYDLSRDVSAGLKDHLKSGDHKTFSDVAKFLGHPEWKAPPSSSDLAGVSASKLSAARDHLYKGAPLGKAKKSSGWSADLGLV